MFCDLESLAARRSALATKPGVTSHGAWLVLNESTMWLGLLRRGL